MRPRLISLNADGSISFQMSKRDRQLVLKQTAIDALGSPELVQRIRTAVADSGKCICNLTLDDLDELVGFVASAANHAKKERLQNELNELADRIEWVLDRFNPSPPEGREPEREQPLLGSDDFLQGVHGETEFTDADEAKKFLSFLVDSYNNAPQTELGGLSPSQLHELIMSDWKDERGAICLNPNLELEELRGAQIFQNARVLLAAVERAGGVKTTTRGNLKRDFVAEMVAAMQWREGYADDLLKYMRKVNEDNVPQLHILRLIMKKQGLLRAEKGLLKATKKGRNALKDENAGGLYRLLFTAYFRKLNLAYMSFGPELPELQHTIAFSYYILAKHARKWKKLEILAPLLLLPVVKESLSNLPGKFAAMRYRNLALDRIIRPLKSFGLLEIQESRGREMFNICRIRKTALFDRFIRFNETTDSAGNFEAHRNKYQDSVIMEVVENQLRNLDPPETRQTYDRLRSEGFSEEEAKRLLAAVVASEMYDVLLEQRPFNLTRFTKALSQLPRLPES